jgi:hypothetical protein
VEQLRREPAIEKYPTLTLPKKFVKPLPVRPAAAERERSDGRRSDATPQGEKH